MNTEEIDVNALGEKIVRVIKTIFSRFNLRLTHD